MGFLHFFLSGGEPHAVQTLARSPGVSESREAFGLRMLQHRFSARRAGLEVLRKRVATKNPPLAGFGFFDG
jgi:hypothetical protein